MPRKNNILQQLALMMPPAQQTAMYLFACKGQIQELNVLLLDIMLPLL